MDEFQEAMMLIKQAVRRLHAPENAEVGENAFAILGVVRRLQPTRVSTLAGELGLAVSTVSRKVEPLVECGWLSVAADPDDQRAHRLSLTRKGVAALRENRRRQMTRYVELLDDETRRQFPEMSKFFVRVAQALHQAAEPTRRDRTR